MSDEFECPTCGDGFDTRQGLGQHHSMTHGEKLRDEKICNLCGDSFPVKPYREDKAKYCSKSCKYEAHSDNQSGTGNSNYDGGMAWLTCPVCEIDFPVKPAESDYRTTCSKGCMSEYYKGLKTGCDHPNYNSVDVECAICGTVKEVNRARAERYDDHLCSKRCKEIWSRRRMSGERNPNWKGGAFPYGPGWNVEKRRKVRIRDQARCQICGITESEHLAEYGREHDIHHIRKARSIDDAEDRNAMQNLITVCRVGCHHIAEQLSPLFPDTNTATAD